MGSHSRIDNPYWVRDEDGGAARNSSGDHRLDRRELLRCARSTYCCTFEEGTGPLIPWAKALLADGTDIESVGRRKGLYSSNRRNW